MMKNILQKVSVLLVVFLMAMTSVAAADITLTYPVGGEYINNDGSTPITWTRIGSCGTGADPVHIEYTADASDPYTLLTTTASASSGLYNWNTLGLPDGNEYIVRISSIGTCSSTDSSGTFTLDSIAPTINSDTLLTPNGGELLRGDSFFDITWDSGDITDTNLGSTPISLYYSTNSGASWTLITSAQANDGSYLWTVPVVNTTAAKVNITATDLAGHTVSDISNAVFTIDSGKPYVDGITYSDDEISQSDTGNPFTAYVSYSEAMDSTAPTFTFSPSLAGTLTSCSGSWVSSDEYDYSCTIADVNQEAEVDVMVTGAKDLAGNTQQSFTDSGALWVDTLAPSVENIAANPDPTSGDVEITVNFSEEMDTSGSLDVELSLSGDGTYSSSGGDWSADGTSWVESFDFISGVDDYSDETVDVDVSDANDLIGNMLVPGSGEFTLDNVAPSGYDSFFDIDYYVGTGNQGNVHFNYEDAEVGTTYYYTVNGTTGSVSGSGVVGSSSLVVVSGINAAGLPDGTLTLYFWLVDDAGNKGPVETDTTEKETVAPEVLSVSTSEDFPWGNGNITESDSLFWVWVQYDESISASVDPVVSFNPSLAGTLSCISDGRDTSIYVNDTYIYACSVTDNGVEVNNVDISVSGAEDVFGNSQDGTYTRADAFDVDLEKPTVINVDVYPEPAAEGPVNLTLTFSEAMDQDVPLDVQVGGLVSSPYIVTGDFVDSTTWVGTFELEDDDEIGSLAAVFINDGQDLPGNVMAENSWTFSIDTVNFYALDIPGNGIGFTQSHPGFWLSLNQLEATNLPDFEVNTVLDASAGPLRERLKHESVSMVWAYDAANETWGTYNVSSGTGDFSSFGWTESPAWYELDLLSSGQYKSIRHDGA